MARDPSSPSIPAVPPLSLTCPPGLSAPLPHTLCIHSPARWLQCPPDSVGFSATTLNDSSLPGHRFGDFLLFPFNFLNSVMLARSMKCNLCKGVNSIVPPWPPGPSSAGVGDLTSPLPSCLPPDKGAVLCAVSRGYWNKGPHSGRLEQQKVMSHSLEARHPRSRCQQGRTPLGCWGGRVPGSHAWWCCSLVGSRCSSSPTPSPRGLPCTCLFSGPSFYQGTSHIGLGSPDFWAGLILSHYT